MPDKKIYVNQVIDGSVTATSFIKPSGTTSQFLKADGSVDPTSYLPTTGGTLTGALNGTTANFVTNIITPLIIGGTGTTSNIIYQSTTNTGTPTGTAHQFVGGVNGATVIATMLNNGNVGIGITAPTAQLSQKSTALLESAPLGVELTDATLWTATSGWTGDYNVGFTHSGGVTTLSRTMSITSATTYQISWTVTGRTAGSFTVGLGGEISNKVFTATGSYGPKTLDGVGALIFTPTTDFNGTITQISVKPITSIYGATYNILDSTGSPIFEIRSSNHSLLNQFIGFGAGRYNTTGYYNMANGYMAMYSNTTGYFNMANGIQSLQNNTTGYSNVSHGVSSLYQNTTGYQNTGIGYGSMYLNSTGFSNTAVGSQSLYNNITGSYNVGIGSSSLYFNTTGSYNVGIGTQALYSNTTGTYNFALGYQSMIYNNTGNNNTAIGTYSLYSLGRILTAGSFTTGVTYTIISSGTTDFTLIGAANSNAGTIFTATGVGTGNGTASANNALNIAFGQAAGQYLANGASPLYSASQSLYIGTSTKASADGVTNENVIGYAAIGNGSNTMTFGASTITGNFFSGNIVVNNTFGLSSKTSGGTILNIFKTDASNNIIIGSGSVGWNNTRIFAGTSERITINGTNGNVLIGSTTDDAINKLQVNGSGAFTNTATNPTADNTLIILNSTVNATTADNTFGNRGLRALSYLTGSKNFTGANNRAISGELYNNGTGNVTYATGLFFSAGCLSTGNITNLKLAELQLYGTGAGVVTNATGLFINSMGVNNTPTNMYGIDINANTTVTGSIKYGIRIGDVSGASTTNTALQTGLGLVKFGDKVVTTNTITATQHNISAMNTAPSSSTDTGTLGEIRYDANFMYVCTATNTWVRSPLTTW